jgi:hypothetical protein
LYEYPPRQAADVVLTVAIQREVEPEAAPPAAVVGSAPIRPRV